MPINPIKETEMRQLLETGKVDVGNGTLFGVKKKRDVDDQHLKLIISTGGSGKSAILSAVQTAEQALKPEYKNYVRFIVVDSSDAEVEEMAKRGFLTIPISTPGANKRMAEEYRTAFFKRFMPQDFPVSEIGSGGSGQKRMMGKMKFYDQDRNYSTTNDEVLAALLGGLFRNGGDWYAYRNLPVDIIILSGLAGGNGSGTFIDIAARARKACLDAGAASVTVYGYLMLPDTAEQWAEDDKSKSSLYSNGFAALKELEHYMCVGKMFSGSEEIIEAPETTSSVTINATNPLYNFPVLISGSYDNATSMIGSTLVNLLASTDGGFGQQEFYSNRDKVRNYTMATNNVSDGGEIKKDVYPEDSHMYCGIGYASATVPEKVVIPYIIGRVSEKLFIADDDSSLPQESRGKKFCDKDHRLTRVEYERAMRTLLSVRGDVKISEKTLWMIISNKFRTVCALAPNTVELSYEEASEGTTRSYRNGFHETQKATEAAEAMVTFLNEFYQTFCTQAAAVMKEFGPRAMWYLWNGSGNVAADGTEEDYSDISLNRMLTVTETGFNSIITNAAQNAVLPNNLPSKGFLGKAFEKVSGKKLSEYKNAFAAAVQASVYQTVASGITGTGGTLKNNFKGAVENYISVCLRFADILEILKDSYQGAGRTLDAANFQEFVKTTGETGNTVNICRTQEMFNWVRDCADTKVKGVKTSQLKEALVDDFKEHSGDWASGVAGVARRRFDEVMSKVCGLGTSADAGNGLKLGITDYFTRVLEGISDAQAQTDAIRRAVDSIYRLLKGQSAPSIDLQDNIKPVTNTTLMIPHDLKNVPMGQTIISAFNQALSGAAAQGNTQANNKVFVSHAISNSIVCYQTCVAVPVSGLKNLGKWEIRGYENDTLNTNHLNCGEYETQYTELSKSKNDLNNMIVHPIVMSPDRDELFGVGLSWKHYPSINLRDYQDDFSSGKAAIGQATTESIYRAGLFRSRIQYALKEHIIECIHSNKGYSYVLNVIPSDWKNLSLAGYPVDYAAGRMERGEKLFRHLADQNPASSSVWRKPIVISDSPFFSAPFDLTQKASASHWTDEKVTEVHRAYMMRIMRKNTYLYRDLMETLYRYADLEQQMLEEEKKYIDLNHARLFCELYLNGVIVRAKSAGGIEWRAMVNERGGNVQIVLIDQMYQIAMDDLNKGFVSDKMDLPIVFREFSNRIREEKLDLGKMEELKMVFLSKLNDAGKNLSEVIKPRMDRVTRNLDQYKDVYGGSKDPATDMLEKYKVPQSMKLEAEKIVKFFAGIQAALVPYLAPVESEEDDEDSFF